MIILFAIDPKLFFQIIPSLKTGIFNLNGRISTPATALYSKQQ